VAPELRLVLKRGMLAFDPAEGPTLSQLVGPTREELVATLVRFLMFLDPHAVPARPMAPPTLDELRACSVQTQVYLTLFRYRADLPSDMTLTEARTLAGELARPARPIDAESMRKPRNREWKMMHELLHRVLELGAHGSAATPLPAPTAATVAAPARSGKRASDLHQPTSAAELDSGFWWRPGTDAYVGQIAAQPALTIFAGADGADDIGPPLHNELIASVLFDWLHSDPLLEGATPDDQDRAVARAIKTVSSWCPPEYLGSALRELVDDGRQRTGEPERLRAGLHLAIGLGRSTSGFVAQGVAYLAFVAARQGRAVRVLSAHFDDDVVNAERQTHRAHPDLSHYSFSASADRRVPISYVSGRFAGPKDTRLALGELDLLDEDQRSGGTTRLTEIRQALTTSTVVFVGTSLTDPGLVSALSQTKDQGPTPYAILLPPDRHAANGPGGTPALDRSMARSLLASRYLHLGVVPIIADFAHQVPQMLREVGLSIDHGRAYKKYADRLAGWWGPRAAMFGRHPDVAIATIDDVRKAWAGRLQQVATEARECAASLTTLRRETITAEIWLRDPDRRELFFWTSSSRSDPQGMRSVHVLDREHDVGQLAFREGRTVSRPISDRRWRYQLSIPVTLDEAPWYHLPVGVINLRSSRADGGLTLVARDTAALGRIDAKIRDVFHLLLTTTP
jgi:hypothetical protein